MANPRKVAVKALIKINTELSYSNITLNTVFSETGIEGSDKALSTALVYGVLERKITLDYVLSKFIKTSLKKVSPFCLEVLRVALFQIMFMDKIPQSAAVNEAVKLVKNSKESRNSGFVNAVLRNILRAENLLPKGNSIAELSIIYSCPESIIESYINDYGLDNAISLLKSSLEPAPLTLKINSLKTDVNAFKAELGVDCSDTDINGAVLLKHGLDISKNPLYNDGKFFVEDLASQKAIKILAPKPFERMLDMCAAPGGKSFSSAILMENKGEIIACDIYEHKCALIEKSAKRLGLDIVKPRVCDATVFNAELGKFDCILCDVLCSGLGIIRRKPEIKYKSFDEFSKLPEIQYKILSNAKNYLKDGGRILYSTCTLRKAENEDVVNKFLAENGDFALEYSHTFMPHTDGTDGFFCALLVKK